MSYLNEFHKKLDQKDLLGLLTLWEEYCTCDEIDGVELKKVLDLIFTSECRESFGPYAESILPLWEALEEGELKDEVFERIMDLQTQHSAHLADLCYDFLKSRFGSHELFLEKIRLVGLRTRENFPRAVRNYKLLTHMNEGRFVYHTAGWGTGEVLDISLIREEVCFEFEHVLGIKKLSFENAFKTLEPIASDHFLAQRFGDPDALEQRAKEAPLEVIKQLLRDLGPKTAAEMKDELLDLVIPKKDWPNWWQSTRNKMKKDTTISSPSSLQEPFSLCRKVVSHFDRFLEELEVSKKAALTQEGDLNHTLVLIYSFMRDFSEELRKEEVKAGLKELIDELLAYGGLQEAGRFALQIFSQETHGKDYSETDLKLLIENLQRPEELIDSIEIASLKKKVLILIRKKRRDWKELFAQLFLVLDQTLLREYLLKELLKEAPSELEQTLEQALKSPKASAEVLYWYLQKVLSDPSLPFADSTARARLLEAYFLALAELDRDRKQLALQKKMVQLLTAKKFASTRKALQGLSAEFCGELLLLVSKCQCFTPHERKIFRSLVLVVCPDLAQEGDRAKEEAQEEIVWTSSQGLEKIKERLEHLSSVEMVDVAREIEEARSHGDLRENSEYKFALERRARIQHEIAQLSEKARLARILTAGEVDLTKVNLGTKVQLQEIDEGENIKELTIMGPWDADTENDIISIQSKMAQALLSKAVGDQVKLEGKSYRIDAIELAALL